MAIQDFRQLHQEPAVTQVSAANLVTAVIQVPDSRAIQVSAGCPVIAASVDCQVIVDTQGSQD